MAETPEVSLVILTRRRAALLRRCLESLPAAAAGCEGLLLFNGEDAETAAWTAEASRRWPWLRVEQIPEAPRGAARNRAVRLTRGKLVYFLDDDTALPDGFLQRLVALSAAHPDAPALGGPNLSAAGASPFQRAVDFLLRSPLGAGPMRARYAPLGAQRRLGGWALMLCSLGVRRDAFERHGLRFPDRCASAEENLLLARLEKRLGPPLYCPSLHVWHERRPGLAAFCDQVFRSGLGRAQITRLEPRSLQPVTLAPAAFWLYLAALPRLAAGHPAALAPALLYAAATAAETARLAWRDPYAALRLPLLLPLAHLCYAAGMAWGAVEALAGRPSRVSLEGPACAAP